MSDLIVSDQSIGKASSVTLHFSLRLEDGSLIDGTAAGQPATFVMGDGSLLPGFEACLVGLRAGDERAFTLASADAFGEHQRANLRELPVSQFEQLDADLEPGLMVSFASPEGELPGVVQGVSGGSVSVDFNHPLAGRSIVFDVTIVAVEAVPGEPSPG